MLKPVAAFTGRRSWVLLMCPITGLFDLRLPVPPLSVESEFPHTESAYEGQWPERPQ